MHNHMKWKQAQAAYQFPLFMVAVIFWVASQIGVSAMAENVYGELAISIPVKAWAGGLLSASSIYLLGIYINGRWRWSASLRFIGALAHSATFGLFSFSASGTPDGLVVSAFSVVFLWVHLWFAWLNLVDLIGATRGRA